MLSGFSVPNTVHLKVCWGSRGFIMIHLSKKNTEMVFWLENKMKQLHQVLSEIHLLAFGGNLCLRKETAARDFESFQAWFLLPQCSSKNFGFAPFGPALPLLQVFFSSATPLSAQSPQRFGYLRPFKRHV